MEDNSVTRSPSGRLKRSSQLLAVSGYVAPFCRTHYLGQGRYFVEAVGLILKLSLQLTGSQQSQACPAGVGPSQSPD